MKRSPRKITYHGRTGYPYIHTTKTGRRYMMVRAEGGGVKRLYDGSLYQPVRGGPFVRLHL